MASLPVPLPWRRFLEGYRAIATDSPAYARLADAFEQRATRVISNELVDRWDANTRDGTVELAFVDKGRLQTTFKPVGRLDGQVFRWARPGEFGPSDEAAIAARTTLASLMAELPTDGEWRIGQRDIVALMSLCAQTLDVWRVFCAPMHGGGLLVMFLDRPPPAAGNVRWLKRLLGRAPVESSTSPFELFHDLIARQVAAVQVEPDKLAQIERLAVQVNTRVAAGEHARALAPIAEIKAMLGKFYSDQEPAGWLLACEGVCRLALGHAREAADAFRESLRSLSPPDVAVLRMGLARTAANAIERGSALAAVYLSAPERFAGLATPEEIASMTARIDRIESTRTQDQDAEAVLRQALAERCAHEADAWRLSEEASAHRTESHVLCEQDAVAETKYTDSYRELLLKWFTVPTIPSLNSMSSEPDQDPARLQSLSGTPIDSSTMDFIAVFSTTYGAHNTYRYRLVRLSILLSGRTLWRIQQIWFVEPHEEIPLL